MKFAVARMAGGERNLARKPAQLFPVVLPLLVLALMCAGISYAETMYKYRGEDGEWVYTDRKPAVQKNSGLQIESLPIVFKDPSASGVVAVTGDVLTAYP